jgi:hypothetical protein
MGVLMNMGRFFNIAAGTLLVLISCGIFIKKGAALEILYKLGVASSSIAKTIVALVIICMTLLASIFLVKFKKGTIFHEVRCNLKLSFVIIFSTIFLFIISAELWVRLKPGDKEIPLHIQILTEEKFPLIDQWSIDRVANNPDKRGQYRDYYIFTNAAPGINTPLFKTLEYYSARYTPDSCEAKDADVIIWTFGGSTMQNMETIDELTIANQIAAQLKVKNVKSVVYNFGTGSFQSTLEVIKFIDLLKRVNRKELPNYVVFYDGFNDAGFTYMFGAINLQWDISLKMKALVNCDNSALFIYSLSNILANHSVLWSNIIKQRIDFALFGPTTDATSNNTIDNLTKGVDAYEMNTKIVRGACKELGIKPVFLLQPMIFTKKNLTAFELKAIDHLSKPQLEFMNRFYEIVRARMSVYNDFYDLTDILDNSSRNDFYDYGHTGPYTGVLIGSNIGNIIASTLFKAKPVANDLVTLPNK